MLKQAFEELQQALLKEVKAYYGARLVSLVIYGSAARGTQRYDSDLDFLLICQDLPAGRIKRVKEFETVEEALASLLAELMERGCAINISPVFKTPEEALKGSPLFLDMVEDARILWDREDFFSGVLERLKASLAALGAKRVWRGNAWYWDLKPDFKPGEVFEI